MCAPSSPAITTTSLFLDVDLASTARIAAVNILLALVADARRFADKSGVCVAVSRRKGRPLIT